MVSGMVVLKANQSYDTRLVNSQCNSKFLQLLKRLDKLK